MAELPPQPHPPHWGAAHLLIRAPGAQPDQKSHRTGPRIPSSFSSNPVTKTIFTTPHLARHTPRKDQLSRAISLPIKKSSLAHYDHLPTHHRHRFRSFIYRTVSSCSLSHPLLGISDLSHPIHPPQAPKRAAGSNPPPSGPTHRF